MIRMLRLLLLLVVLAGAALSQRVSAQAPQPGPAVPGATMEPDVLPGLPRPPDAPRSLMQEASPVPAFSCAPLPGPYLEQDPRLDPPPLPAPGWFTDLGVEIVHPHFKDRLFDFVQFGNRPPDLLHVPGATLDWTGSPRFEIGYRLPSGFGEFVLDYRFLVTEGSSLVPGPDAVATTKSRLDMNVADLDYASREFSLWPNWDMKWRFGLRGVDVYFDSRADEPFAAAAAGSGVFDRRTSNDFWGVGPHVGLELARRLGCSGLAVVASADGATLLGRVTQNFFEESTTPAGNGQFLSGNTHRSNPQDVPVINAFFGLGWHPPGYRNTRLFLGYEYEYWWNIGRLSITPSKGELSDQGVLLRAEFNF